MSLHSLPRKHDLSSGIRLLILDAGGPRGVSQLKILVELMHRCSTYSQENINHPCIIFDMISGVGSGGFIAILLVVLGLTAQEALEDFIGLSTSVLEAKDLDAQARTTALKLYIANLFDTHGFDKNLRLLDPNARAKDCRLAVPISYKRHVGPICTLRNYNVRQEQSLNLTIVDALLATLATPPLFSPVSVTKDSATFEYVGGDIMLSNPTREAILEAYSAFGPDEKVGCLLNLGCGDLGVISIPDDPNLASWNTFLSQTTADGDRVAGVITSQMGHLGIYHRFSVNRGLGALIAAGAANSEAIIAQTSEYLENEFLKEKIDNLVKLLTKRHGISSLEWLVHSGGETILRPSLPSLINGFVMRQEPWEFIEREMLDRFGALKGHPQRPLVVTGAEGCGKTQLIRNFVKVYGSRFASTFFIDSSSDRSIQEDIRQIVRALDPGYSNMTFKDCLDFLARPFIDGPCLLIYDNFDDPKLDPLLFLPPNNACATIIISRNQQLGKLFPEAHLMLGVMSEYESIETLLYGSKEDPTLSEEDREEEREEARVLARALGCLPIALTQARSYISQTKCSASTYLQILNSNRNRLLAKPIKYERDMRSISPNLAVSLELPPN